MNSVVVLYLLSIVTSAFSQISITDLTVNTELNFNIPSQPDVQTAQRTTIPFRIFIPSNVATINVTTLSTYVKYKKSKDDQKDTVQLNSIIIIIIE